MTEYRRCFRQPDTIYATCEDDRASTDIDLEMDQLDEDAGHRVSADVLALWGSKGTVGKLWDVLEVWCRHAHTTVTGRSLNAGHHLPEEQPDEVLNELNIFFDA
jgi:haloacetate dehalogenase